MAGNLFHGRTLLQMEILLCTGTVSQFVVAAIVFTSFDRRHGQEIDVACSSVLPTTYYISPFFFGQSKGKGGQSRAKNVVFTDTSILAY